MAKAAEEAASARAKFDGGTASEEHAWPLIGVFDVRTERVLNGFALGSFGVRGHSDAIPPSVDRRTLGGYTLFVRASGRTAFAGSGGVQAEITPGVRRAVLRHYGLRPADESAGARLKRWALRAWDEIKTVLPS
jgi:hypothetical protein